MKLASIQSPRNSILLELQQVRQNTLDLLAEIDESLFFVQAHPDFSPIGWHFGHIAFTEAYWILEYLVDSRSSFVEYDRLFAADGLPKIERQNLPKIPIIENYLTSVRNQVLEYLTSAPIESQERLWRWLIQHESQHCETITLIWELHRLGQSDRLNQLSFSPSDLSFDSQNQSLTEMVKVEAGEFTIGSNSIKAQDNECPTHKIYLDTYWIDRFPVTNQKYHQFIAADGYQKSQYWSTAGWEWLQKNPVSQPLYWRDSPDWQDHPVCGVSYYEAEAYAKFVNKRLPTEAEWEKAAMDTSLLGNHSRAIGHTTPVDTYPGVSKYGCQDMLGNVWEWTQSWFAGYPEFSSYPYTGYSQVYFDQQHKVLKGGSWATGSSSLRTSFRNWYHPHVRQILAGFRLCQDYKID